MPQILKYNEAIVKRVKALRGKGHSYSEIAAIIGGISKTTCLIMNEGFYGKGDYIAKGKTTEKEPESEFFEHHPFYKGWDW